MTDDLKGIPTPFDHLHDNIFRLRSHTQMDLLCTKSQDCPGPVVASVGIRYHLALVHYSYVEIFVFI